MTADRAEHLVLAQLTNRMSREVLVGDDSQSNILYCMKCLLVFLKRVLDKALIKKSEDNEATGEW